MTPYKDQMERDGEQMCQWILVFQDERESLPLSFTPNTSILNTTPQARGTDNTAYPKHQEEEETPPNRKHIITSK